MKRTTRKKKKERTWAEAATQVLARENGRSLGVREIQQKIYEYKLKDIKMNKLAENVLKTMLSHHANMEDCPFYKVKDKSGYYALKADIPPCSVSSSKAHQMDEYDEESDTHDNIVQHESDEYQQNDEAISMLPRRRVTDHFLDSLPSKIPNLPTLDLETPHSILTNTHLKSVINNSTFATLPHSYQMTLLHLLPTVDHKTDESGMSTILPTALTNEFFSQALQDWVSKLSEGEFTRETQAKISQEFYKESSKISPWKEKFFEEYYGQKSHDYDVTCNYADLSFEAQVRKFRKVQDSVVNDDKYQIDDSSDLWEEKNFWPDSPIDMSPKEDTDSVRLIYQRPHLHYPNFDHLSRMHASDDWMPMYPNLRVREDFYHSDMSDSADEISDTNSYHQHATTDESEQSSDEIMNIGDDNLLDVDEEDAEIIDDRSLYPVVSEHSYTKLPSLKRKLSEDRIWKRSRSTIATVMPVTCSDESYKGAYTSNTGSTLVLRPKDNLRLSVQAITCNEENNDTSPKQYLDTSLVTKNLSVSKVSSEERVGVLFSKELHAENHSEKQSEDEVVPKITIYKDFSEVLSNGATVHGGTLERLQRQKDSCEKDSDSVHTLRSDEKSGRDERNESISQRNCKNSSVVPDNSSTLKSVSQETNVDQQYPEAYKLPSACPSSEVLLPPRNNAKVDFGLVTPSPVGDIQTSSNDALLCTKINDYDPPDYDSTTSNTKLVVSQTEDRKDNFSKTRSVAHKEITEAVASTEIPSSSVTGAIYTTTENSRNLTGKKRPQANIRSGPVKRTKTLAEIKAQMKAKKMASISLGSSSQNCTKTNKAPARDIASVQNDASNVPHNNSQDAKSNNTEHGSLCKSKSSVHELDIEKKELQLSSSPLMKDDSFQNEFGNNRVLTEESGSPQDVYNLKAKEDRATVKPQGIETALTNEKIVLKIKAERGKTYSVEVKTTDHSLEDEKVDKSEMTQMDSYSHEVVGINSSTSEAAFPKEIPKTCRVQFSTTPKKDIHDNPPELDYRGEFSSSTQSSDIVNNSTGQSIQIQNSVLNTSCSTSSASHATPGPQKYQTTSKGKSWVQMQQLAISNMDQLDVSDVSETDSEEMISILSSGSSLDNDECHSNEVCDLLSNSSNSRNSMISNKVENIFDARNSKESEIAKQYSSRGDLAVKFDCACSCSRLLLCKGCGAYTHEECLSSNSLCSLCITY